MEFKAAQPKKKGFYLAHTPDQGEYVTTLIRVVTSDVTGGHCYEAFSFKDNDWLPTHPNKQWLFSPRLRHAVGFGPELVDVLKKAPVPQVELSVAQFNDENLRSRLKNAGIACAMDMHELLREAFSKEFTKETGCHIKWLPNEQRWNAVSPQFAWGLYQRAHGVR